MVTTGWTDLHEFFADANADLRQIAGHLRQRSSTRVAAEQHALFTISSAFPWPAAREQFVVDCSGEKQVAARIIPRGIRAAFQGRILECSLDIIAAACLTRRFRPSQPKIHQLCNPIAAHEHIGELEITVSRPFADRILQPQTDVQQTSRRLDRVEHLANLQEVAKIPTLHEFHREEVKATFTGDFKNGHNIRMPELLADPSLTLESGDSPRIVHPAITKQLQSHHAARFHIGSAKNASKTAGCVAVQQLVIPQHKAFGFSLENTAGLQRSKHLLSFQQLERSGDVGTTFNLGTHLLPHVSGDQTRSEQKHLQSFNILDRRHGPLFSLH